MIGNIPIGLIASVGAIVWSGFAGYSYSESKWEKKIADQRVQIEQLQTKSEQVTTKTITQYVDRVRIVKEKGDTIIKEVPRYVSKESDDKCVIATGFVRIHDAAAKNQIPESTGTSNESDSGIKLSTVSETVATNYNKCHEVMTQLTSLQQWIKDQQALFNAE